MICGCDRVDGPEGFNKCVCPLFPFFPLFPLVGAAAVGEVALSTHESRTAERLKEDFWLYFVFDCATDPKVHVINDPVKLGWEPLVKIEHYHVGADETVSKAESDGSRDMEN